jgi:hypothetical protein
MHCSLLFALVEDNDVLLLCWKARMVPNMIYQIISWHSSMLDFFLELCQEIAWSVGMPTKTKEGDRKC